MKKTYINPEMETFDFKVQNCLLAGSPNAGLNPNDPPVNPGGIEAPVFDFD